MDDAGCELNMAGFFSDITINGAQLVAGRYEFFDAFKKNFAPQYEQLVEMAVKVPDLLGLSIEPSGYLAYVDTAGVEYSARPEGVDLAYDGLPAFRVTHLFAAAFVSVAAANDGLFAQLGSRLGRLFGANRLKSEATLYTLAPNEGAALHIQETQSTPMPLSIAQIHAKFGADEARFTQAVKLAAQTAEITIEALEAKLVVAELAAKDNQVATLTVKLAAIEKTLGDEKAAHAAALTALAAERDDFKTKLAVIKDSGFTGVPLGVPNGGATVGAPAVNPYAKRTRNLSAQARLEKDNAELAAQLKAEASALDAAHLAEQQAQRAGRKVTVSNS